MPSLGTHPAEALLFLSCGWSRSGLATNNRAFYTFSFLTLLYSVVSSVVPARDRECFWLTGPSKTLLLALAADAFTGTGRTFVGLPDFTPLPWDQMLAILGYATVCCLVVNDTVKGAMINLCIFTSSN